jgi:hypothetical protein
VISEPNYSHFKIRACAETGKLTFLRHPEAHYQQRCVIFLILIFLI